MLGKLIALLSCLPDRAFKCCMRPGNDVYSTLKRVSRRAYRNKFSVVYEVGKFGIYEPMNTEIAPAALSCTELIILWTSRAS